jgi:phosphinothricin acetyltransferase
MDTLQRALAAMHERREGLLSSITPLAAGDMAQARPGGWSVGRVLQHVIESEHAYAKLIAHLAGRVAPEGTFSAPRGGTEAAEMLGETRAGVRAMLEGIDDTTLYRLARIGHEEYSPLSVIENIAAHDEDHHRQIVDLLAMPVSPARDRATDLVVRPARDQDLPALTEIYNHYVVRTPITFDIEPYMVEQRRPWFEQFGQSGAHRLFVAERQGTVLGYACSHQFRAKAAYDTTIETTVYLRPDACGAGAGSALYRALFAATEGTDVRMAVAGVTLPNEASIALHERFGFTRAGIMHAVGRKFGAYWDVAWYEKPLRGIS